uniref:Dynein light chain n=1 Tax=Calidris pygmaea TaxID=425635 RepID=A0A8C3KNT7_9CHAR
MALTRLEKENRDLAEVEVDEVLGLMSHVAAKVPSHDAVPSGVVFLVKLLSNVLLDVVLLQGLSRALHGVLLHLLRHVRILDHCLSVTHDCLSHLPGARPGTAVHSPVTVPTLCPHPGLGSAWPVGPEGTGTAGATSPPARGYRHSSRCQSPRKPRRSSPPLRSSHRWSGAAGPVRCGAERRSADCAPRPPPSVPPTPPPPRRPPAIGPRRRPPER